MYLEKDTLDEVIIGMSLETGSTIHVKIDGQSMWPLIKSGAVLGISPECKKIKKGDIIIFRSCDRLIAHRVIRIYADIIITKGDALIFFDPYVQLRDIIGRAVFIESEGRRTEIDTGVWRLLNCILANYSCACGVILGGIPKGIKPAHHSSRISSTINLVVPMFIHMLTRRL